MGQVILATLPIFLLIFVGTLVYRRGFLGQGFWRETEKLIYFVLFPCLLLESVAKAQLGDLEILPMAGAILCAMAVMTAAMLMLRPWLGVDGPAFTSMYQGVIRMNTYLAFAVAAGVGGQPAVEATAVSVAVFVPAANLLCVTLLVRYAGAGGQGSLRRTVIAVAKNPLILSILGGILLNVTGIGVPPVIGPMLSILGDAALGLGLISVGAGLDFVHARASGRTVLLTTVLKLLIMPALGYGFCILFDVHGVACFAVVLLNGMPTAGAAYILARQMGGDAPLVASIITVETALSMATLPVVLALAV